jgi:hypothetical protein
MYPRERDYFQIEKFRQHTKRLNRFMLKYYSHVSKLEFFLMMKDLMHMPYDRPQYIKDFFALD